MPCWLLLELHALTLAACSYALFVCPIASNVSLGTMFYFHCIHNLRRTSHTIVYSIVAINSGFKLFHTLQVRERAVIANGGATLQIPVVSSLGLKTLLKSTSHPHHHPCSAVVDRARSPTPQHCRKKQLQKLPLMCYIQSSPHRRFTDLTSLTNIYWEIFKE